MTPKRTTWNRTLKLSNNKNNLPGIIKRGNDYIAKIRFNGKTHIIGYYADAHQAFEAYMKTARDLGVKITLKRK